MQISLHEPAFNSFGYIPRIGITGPYGALAQAAITNCNGPGSFDNKHLFLTVLEAEKSKIEMPANPMSGEKLPPV